MILRTIATGSSGNCHALISSTGEILLLDLGVTEKTIKKGIDWKISSVVGTVVTHRHLDHSLAIKDFKAMGIPVYAPYIRKEPMEIGTEFIIQAFDLTTLAGDWTHTDTSGEPCPCYGFLITHREMGKLVYVTDTELCKWRFHNVNHILLGVNYDNEVLASNDTKNNHVIRGHMSIDTSCEFVKANASDQLQNVIMCHLSNGNADAGKFIEKMKAVVPRVNVDVAEPGKYWELKNPGECQF